MASMTSTTSFDDLPQEMAANILFRLPVKALIRSTSVNKKWYSLITNPHFISAQIKHAISHSHHNAVFIIPPYLCQDKQCSLVSAETSKLIENYEVPFATKSNGLHLVGSVDGLMLLTDSHLFYNSQNLYLWNPCIKSHRILVSSCFKKLVVDRDRGYFIVGLGFSRSSDDYRVVRIAYDVKKKVNFAKVEVYSLRKQTWKKIKDPVVPRVCSADGVYVNGSFYWLDMNKLSTQSRGRPFNTKDLWMLSFDFDTELFGEVKFPEKVSNCLGVGARFKLMEFEGSLALCVSDIQHSNGVTIHPYHVWLMRQENGVLSWNLRFRAELKEGGFARTITKAGTILLEMHPFRDRLDVTGILSCNLKTMHYNDLGFGRHSDSEDFRLLPELSTVDASFVESLVMYEGGKSLLKFSK